MKKQITKEINQKLKVLMNVSEINGVLSPDKDMMQLVFGTTNMNEALLQIQSLRDKRNAQSN